MHYNKLWILFVLLYCALNLSVAFSQTTTWETCMADAKKSFEKGDYLKAEVLSKAALNEARKFKENDPRLEITFQNLAHVYQTMGKYAQAEVYYKEALFINERVFGKDHPNAANIFNNLGSLYAIQQNYPRAEKTFRKALVINEQVLGKNHPAVATILNNLASIYYIQGDYGNAELLYQQALAIREKALGPTHPEVTMTINNLAMLYQACGEKDKADLLLNRLPLAKAKMKTIKEMRPASRRQSKLDSDKKDETMRVNDTLNNHVPKDVKRQNLKSSASEKSMFVANHGGKAYHFYSCSWVNNYPFEKLKKYSSAKEALKTGLHPCRRCRPPAN